ncbi:MAG TPA: DUF4173 domain-containing protein [Trichormus sp.]|jgi:hypothetical protein
MKSGIFIVCSAGILGLLSDLLFYDAAFKSQPWGLNLLAWLVCFSGFVVVFLHYARRAKSGLSFLILAVNFAAVACWRDSSTLRALDLIGLCTCMGLACYVSQGFDVVKSGLTQCVAVALDAAAVMVTAPVELLLRHIEWKGVMGGRMRAIAGGTLRGALMALPLVLIFGGLFVAADAAFERLVSRSLNFDCGTLVQHALVAGVSGWAVMAFLFTMVSKDWKNNHQEGGSSKLQMGTIELATVLGSLDLLFLTFVIVQFRYFFGGANLVKLTAGLSCSEYARRGFFELVWVAALVLPLLLLLDFFACGSAATKTRKRLFKMMASVQLGLLSVIMISAVQRMMLYQGAYGMTELRLYTTAFMGWIFVLSMIFIGTVLRGKRAHFALAGMVSGFAVIFALHALNPDNMIVQMNIARARAGHDFDAEYALSLSNDAIPALLANIDSLPKESRQPIAAQLMAVADNSQHADWRSWNWSRSHAQALVQNDKHALESMADLKIRAISQAVR